MAKRKVKRRRRGRVKRASKAFSGGLVRGRMHPPTNSASPWNCYVLTATWTVATAGLNCIDVSSVVALLASELGLTADFDIRILRLDVWVPPAQVSGDKNCIVFAPDDWTNKQSECKSRATLNWYEAWGTAVQPAHVHYVWPKSVSTQVLVTGSKAIICTFDVPVVNTKYITKTHLQWRPNTPDPRPTTIGLLESIRHQTSSIADYDYCDQYGGSSHMYAESCK